MRQLEAWKPRSLIAVGDGAIALLREFVDAQPDRVLDVVTTETAADCVLSLDSARRYDFGLVAGYLEHVDGAQGSAVIARLRDVLVKRLCVIVPSGEDAEGQSSWSDAEMSAFGLKLLARFKHDGADARLFGFDIASYKQTPDWLNPKHWAHPEMWGKFRW